jgi:hypothetical protein
MRPEASPVSAILVIGALLVLAGIVWMARAAIARGRLSDPRHNPGDAVDVTLEPQSKGLGFLRLGVNWPGLLLIVLGGLMLLSPLVL